MKIVVSTLVGLGLLLSGFGSAFADPPPNNCPSGSYPSRGGCYQPRGTVAPSVFRCYAPKTVKVKAVVLEDGTRVLVKRCE